MSGSFLLRSALLAGFAAASLSAISLSAQTKPISGSSASILSLTSNGEPLEIAAFAGIRVVRSGGVLFAEAKPVTVKLRTGMEGAVRLMARNGAGPGEYRAGPQFVSFRADSIAAYDAGQLRWSLLSPNGSFVRLLATGPDATRFETRAAWVAQGAIVFNASLDSSVSPHADVIGKIVAQEGSTVPLVIRQSDNGNLWTASAFVATNWTVYNATGKRMASHKFPVPFRLMFANDTTAIGDILDQDDAPQLMTMHFKKMPSIAAPSKITASPVTPTEPTPRQIALRQVLKQMVMQQERNYSHAKAYTLMFDSLRVELPSGMQVRIVQADSRGWFAIAMDKESRATCAMGVGYAVIGWHEARPYCSE